MDTLGNRERRRAGRMGWHRRIERRLNLRDGRLMLPGRDFTSDGQVPRSVVVESRVDGRHQENHSGTVILLHSVRK